MKSLALVFVAAGLVGAVVFGVMTAMNPHSDIERFWTTVFTIGSTLFALVAIVWWTYLDERPSAEEPPRTEDDA